jgi:hypothetical protein
MSQPVHAYSSLSNNIHHRAGNRFADSGEYPRRCDGAFPDGRQWRDTAPGGRPRMPCTSRDEMCGGVDVRAVHPHSGCLHMWLTCRHDRQATAQAAATCLPGLGLAVREPSTWIISPGHRPLALRVGGPVGPAGWTAAWNADAPRPMQPPSTVRADRLDWRATVRRGARPGQSGWRPRPGRRPRRHGGGPADQLVGYDALLSPPDCLHRCGGQAVPQHAADVLGVI